MVAYSVKWNHGNHTCRCVGKNQRPCRLICHEKKASKDSVTLMNLGRSLSILSILICILKLMSVSWSTHRPAVAIAAALAAAASLALRFLRSSLIWLSSEVRDSRSVFSCCSRRAMFCLSCCFWVTRLCSLETGRQSDDE